MANSQSDIQQNSQLPNGRSAYYQPYEDGSFSQPNDEDSENRTLEIYNQLTGDGIVSQETPIHYDRTGSASQGASQGGKK